MDLGAVKTCEMCKRGLLVNLGDFNVTDFYQKHQQSRVRDAHTSLPPQAKWVRDTQWEERFSLIRGL